MTSILTTNVVIDENLTFEREVCRFLLLKIYGDSPFGGQKLFERSEFFGGRTFASFWAMQKEELLDKDL